MEKQGLCCITETKNNMFGVLCDSEGNVKYELSTGKVNMGGRKKKTVYGASGVGIRLAERIKEDKYDVITVKVKGGLTRRVRGVLEGLVKQGIKIKEIECALAFGHNGVRIRKGRSL